MKSIKLILVSALMFSAVACQQNNEKAPANETVTPAPVADVKLVEQPVKEQTPVKKSLPYRGTVKYIGLEGGFFGIVTDKGQKFLPFGLPKEYLSDGAIIEFSGTVKKDVMTIQQWGTPFSIKQIKLIKAGEPVGPDGKELM